ncbi:CDP-diacylglycerol--glycerol-3-phosphate 3-phosphatidyltransferase [Pseudoscardovia suis]|uniref:CDP-diacylglycerol--glycerol-3-phosphate 3-phosphatidyltransferase n=1 Tax=Pseudoscardovia suis TaxID=987063 RepID=A0A261ES56_9BIFI|nr:CDP-diacylglycerol--glycerol-3-phosphate 3-phosphatidyltransferase [Pseudoscardovia suis]OZG49683.1 CDP-diacylglycerol--glycerol-3-phosphate 3-phosphatidyltransferase [Pseudoscardovia suis]PJJ69802.1 CDP-diacylglycerol--glycerol-3-phosphate 3-phosphatidyltransferase [Pseudoscardovia suis]
MAQQQSNRPSLLDGWRTVPNFVTMGRIALVVVFLIMLGIGGPDGSRGIGARWAAFVLFVLAAISDKLDGYLARKYNKVTELGKLLDPIADKLLVCGALVMLAAFGELNPGGWVITALFLIRELGITIMRFFVIDTGGSVIAANHAGKLKTLFECIGLGMVIFPMWSLVGGNTGFEGFYYWLSYAVVLVALVLCLYSGGVYVAQVKRAGGFGRKA